MCTCESHTDLNIKYSESDVVSRMYAFQYSLVLHVLLQKKKEATTESFNFIFRFIDFVDAASPLDNPHFQNNLHSDLPKCA